MNVADRVTSEGIVPYKTVCTLIGQSSNLQYNAVRSAVATFLHNFDIKTLNVGLSESLLFHDKKIYTVSNFREKKS